MPGSALAAAFLGRPAPDWEGCPCLSSCSHSDADSRALLCTDCPSRGRPVLRQRRTHLQARPSCAFQPHLSPHPNCLHVGLPRAHTATLPCPNPPQGRCQTPGTGPSAPEPLKLSRPASPGLHALFLPVETTRKALVQVYPSLCLLIEVGASPSGPAWPGMACLLLLGSVTDLTFFMAIISCPPPWRRICVLESPSPVEVRGL